MLKLRPNIVRLAHAGLLASRMWVLAGYTASGIPLHIMIQAFRPAGEDEVVAVHQAHSVGPPPLRPSWHNQVSVERPGVAAAFL